MGLEIPLARSCATQLDKNVGICSEERMSTTVCGKLCPGGFVDLDDPNTDCSYVKAASGNRYYDCSDPGSSITRCCCEATASG